MNLNDIGIRCDYFLPMTDGSPELQRDIFLGIRGSQIAEIKPWNPQTCQARTWVQARRKVVLPGLINGHTHLAMSLFRGLADDHPFAQWLHETILPLEAALVNAEFVRVGTSLAALECIRMGVTTVNEMYFYTDVVANVLSAAGLRGFVGEAVTDFPSPADRENNGARYRIMEQIHEKYSTHERIQPSIGPHASYTCSDATILKARDFAYKKNLLIHIHVSETQEEVQSCLKSYGKTPVQRLRDLGLMAGKTVFAHGVHLSATDIDCIAETATAVIYNPESNMKLSSGVAPIHQLLERGIRVGIGTDGAASNNDLSLFREMDTGAKLQKLSQGNNTAMTAADALRLATIGGARALGIDQRVGSLEVGKLADVIVVDLNYPHLQPVHNIASLLVYSASGLEVDTVICHGTIILDNGQYQTMDAQKIITEAAYFQERIQEKLSA
ncbi:5-methylthioadenosine/S-adenosylhomocysteine deaminase [Gammaproteobacteria bacterium]